MTGKIYQSFRRLLVTLGRLDAAHELAELAMRHLSEGLCSGVDFEVAIGELALKHELHVRVKSSEAAHRIIAMSGIASAHACYEAFLSDLVEELRCLSSLEIDFSSLEDGITKHDHFVTCLRRARVLPKSSRLDLLELVIKLGRLIRNEQAHTGQSLPKRIQELRTQIHAASYWDEVFSHRDRPSSFDALGFEDFLLHTQAVRLTAEHFCLCLLPSYEAIAAHPEVAGFIERKGSEKLGNFLRDRFALAPADAIRVCSLV